MEQCEVGDRDMQIRDGRMDENIIIEMHKGLDAGKSDREVEQRVHNEMKCEGEMFCVKCDESQEEICMPVQEEEGEAQRGVRDPGEPTISMREEHELTHWPYRSWCSACVRARGRDNPSRRVEGGFDEHVLPRIRMDYGFLTEDVEYREGENGEEQTQVARESMTMAVVQESLLGSIWTYAVEAKGISETWFVEQLLEDMETIGLKNERVVVKSDQEPAIVEVMKEVQRRRESDYGTALDNSRVGDSDSNGTIESMVGLAEGMARVLRFSIEDRIGTKLKMSDPIMPWLVRHAGHVLTRSRIRENGRTAMQLIKGRRSNTELVPFGESVLFRIPHGKSKPGKFEEQWEFGVYVGFVIRSGESLVATKDGVFRVTSIRRRPSSERWS